MGELTRILIIDDDEPGRQVMGLLLRKAGFAPFSAANGAEEWRWSMKAGLIWCWLICFCLIKTALRSCRKSVRWRLNLRWW